MTSIEVHLPPISNDQISSDLRWLTRHLTESGKVEPYAGGLLGGEWGYGVEFENNTFMMHPFCWCGRDDCPWCWGCECPEEATIYRLASGKQVDSDEFFDNGGYRTGTTEDVPELTCAYCKGERASAPNFLHKPSGTTVHWYKYIGRGMETDVRGDWRGILSEVRDSLTP